MGQWLKRLRKDPTDWLLEKSCPPIRYRLLTEIKKLGESDHDVSVARKEAYTYKPAQDISTRQSDDGTWFSSHLGFESLNVQRKRGPGMAAQYHALIEYGWTKDHPIIWRTSERLQALLWEDKNIDLLEQKGYCGGDPAVEQYLRRNLSWRALGLLSRGGFNDEAGVQRKSVEIVNTLDAFYSGDVESKLVVGTRTRPKETDEGIVDEVCTVLTCKAPLLDHALMLFFAWNEAARRSDAGRRVLARIVDYLFSRPPAPVPVVEVGGKVFDCDMDLLIRSLDRKDFEEGKQVGRLLQELEVLARCGLLLEVPKAVALLDWLIGLVDDEGVVRADEWIEKHSHRVDYPYFPLEDNWRGKHKKFTDLTFRLMLVLSILDDQAAS